MARINLPPGCAGISDGDWRRMADKPGGFITLDETDPVEKRQLQKLKNQDYASAGLVGAGPEKKVARGGPEGRWCPSCPCNTIFHSWTKVCPECDEETIPESDMTRVKLAGQYR